MPGSTGRDQIVVEHCACWAVAGRNFDVRAAELSLSAVVVTDSAAEVAIATALAAVQMSLGFGVHQLAFPHRRSPQMCGHTAQSCSRHQSSCSWFLEHSEQLCWHYQAQRTGWKSHDALCVDTGCLHCL